MRNVLMLSAAVSALALGIGAHHVAALSPGAKAVSSDGLVQQVQKGGESTGSRQSPGAGKGDDRGKDGARAKDGAKDGGPTARQGEGSDRGAKMRSGDKGARGDDAKSRQRSKVDVDVRGRRGDGADRRTRVDIDVDRRRRPGRDVDVNIRGGYGYTPTGCQDLLRRYRQCIGR